MIGYARAWSPLLMIAGCIGRSCPETYTTQVQVQGRGPATQTAGTDVGGATVYSFLGMVGDYGEIDPGDVLPHTVSITADGSETNVEFDASPIVAALQASQADLTKAAGGVLLVGQTFTLPTLTSANGWLGAAATATVDVVPAVTTPAPLLTLSIAFAIQPTGGGEVDFAATTDVAVDSETTGMGGCGD